MRVFFSWCSVALVFFTGCRYLVLFDDFARGDGENPTGGGAGGSTGDGGHPPSDADSGNPERDGGDGDARDGGPREPVVFQDRSRYGTPVGIAVWGPDVFWIETSPALGILQA